MKKYLAIFLALVIVICCCGCFSGGSGSTDNVRGEISSNNYPAAPTEAAPEFSFGSASGNTYRNDFLGLSCSLPSDWTFYTDAQILEMNNLVGDVLDEEAARKMQNATIIYDMMASNATGNSMNVNLEKFTALQMLTLNIQEVLESQIAMIESSYNTMNYTDVTVQYQKVTVDGKQYDALVIDANLQGTSFQCICFAFVKGNYMANVSVSSFTGNCNEILSCFSID